MLFSTWARAIWISIIIVDNSLGKGDSLLRLDIHVDRNKGENIRKVYACPQSTASRALIVAMTQQHKWRL